MKTVFSKSRHTEKNKLGKVKQERTEKGKNEKHQQYRARTLTNQGQSSTGQMSRTKE